jgi:hypothetical protein
VADIDELEQQVEDRTEELHRAEQELVEQLDQRGQIEVWNRIRTMLHCEKFLASRTGKRVADRLIRTITDAQTEWLLADDPAKPEAREAHRRAQAAHMALFALGEILAEGHEAEIDLRRIELEIGSD